MTLVLFPSDKVAANTNHHRLRKRHIHPLFLLIQFLNRSQHANNEQTINEIKSVNKSIDMDKKTAEYLVLNE